MFCCLQSVRSFKDIKYEFLLIFIFIEKNLNFDFPSFLGLNKLETPRGFKITLSSPEDYPLTRKDRMRHHPKEQPPMSNRRLL